MLIIGSRGSQLALWQAHHIQARLKELGHESDIRIIKTTGDKIQDVPLNQVGTKGLFTKEIEEALLAKEIDLAVHSLKDMPTELPPGLVLSGIPERVDPRDALVGKTLDELASGAHVGTSSLRRSAQLKSLRPDLHIESIRGNVDTRLRKLDEGQFDAILLAVAGLTRLGLTARITQAIDPQVMCPAVGQGALAIETRHDHGAGHQAAQQLNHEPTKLCVTAERAVLAAMGGGCQVPLGAYATLQDGDWMRVVSVVCSPDGQRVVRDEIEGPALDASLLGAMLADRMLNEGAREILSLVYGEA